MAFLLAGCNIMEDMDNKCPNIEDSDYVNISFNLVIPIEGNSRADENDHDEVSSEWPEFEDKIYTDDFVIYIYTVTSDGAEPLLAKIDVSSLPDSNASISGGPDTYTLNVALPKSEFEKHSPVSDAEVTFKVAVFANTKNKTDLLTDDNESSFSELIQGASAWHYSIFGMIYGSPNTTAFTESPRIPMYGTITFKTPRELVYKSRPEYPIWGGDLYMLRSTAKIQVIDGIIHDNDKKLPRVENVTFKGATASAYDIPFDAKNYRNGWQVTKPNIYTEPSPSLSLILNGEDKKWFGYVPELKVSDSKFIIEVTYSLNADGSPNVQERFEIPMTGYRETEFYFGENILRNHIYTLKVNSVEAFKPQIEVSVKEWKKINYTYEY